MRCASLGYQVETQTTGHASMPATSLCYLRLLPSTHSAIGRACRINQFTQRLQCSSSLIITYFLLSSLSKKELHLSLWTSYYVSVPRTCVRGSLLRGALTDSDWKPAADLFQEITRGHHIDMYMYVYMYVCIYIAIIYTCIQL